MSVYYVFAIKCTIDGSYYLGTSTRKTANTIGYMIDTYRKDNTKYVKLNKAIENHGRNNFICSRISETFNCKEDAEKYVYEKLIKLGDRVLNDVIISPEREECLLCNKKIRKDFIELHEEKYCTGKAFDEIIGL
jgi:hypothetical protein